MNKKSNVKVMSNFETCWDDPNEKEEEEEIENEKKKMKQPSVPLCSIELPEIKCLGLELRCWFDVL